MSLRRLGSAHFLAGLLTVLSLGHAPAAFAQAQRVTTVLVDKGSPSRTLRVTLPRDGSTVGSPTVDVRGRLYGSFRTPGTTVTVDGVPASITQTSRAFSRFLLPNVELATGQNLVVVEATTPAGEVARFDVGVNHVPMTANNVVLGARHAYGSRGTQGLGVMDLGSRMYWTIPQAVTGLNRIDDVAIADGFLFALDAANGGRLAVLSLADPEAPVRVSGPVTVPVGPFAGVSAAGGRVVVSGGTGLMTVRTYSPQGVLGAAVASVDLGIGQPDVLLDGSGTRAFVSTDFAGSVGGAGFGITTVTLNTPPLAPTVQNRIGLFGAGFTGGFQAPANFPIESAEIPGGLLVAHGGGLSRVDSSGGVVGTLPLGFGGVGVDAVGGRAFVVGASRSFAELSVSGSGAPQLVSSRTLPGPGALTGVAANSAFIAIAANAGGLRVMRR